MIYQLNRIEAIPLLLMVLLLVLSQKNYSCHAFISRSSVSSTRTMKPLPFVGSSAGTNKESLSISSTQFLLIEPHVSFDWSLAGSKKKGATSSIADEGIKRTKKNNHEKWQPYYDALAAYQQEHGHCNVPLEQDGPLHEWLEEQRTSYKNLKLGRKTKLTRKRAVALEMVAGAIPAELLDL